MLSPGEETRPHAGVEGKEPEDVDLRTSWWRKTLSVVRAYMYIVSLSHQQRRLLRVHRGLGYNTTCSGTSIKQSPSGQHGLAVIYKDRGPLYIYVVTLHGNRSCEDN